LIYSDVKSWRANVGTANRQTAISLVISPPLFYESETIRTMQYLKKQLYLLHLKWKIPS